MRESVRVACIHARKRRIRQRLDRYHYRRRPFRFTRSAAISMAGGLIFLVLTGVVALSESMAFSHQIHKTIRSTR
jgi:hypothetical protein